MMQWLWCTNAVKSRNLGICSLNLFDKYAKHETFAGIRNMYRQVIILALVSTALANVIPFSMSNIPEEYKGY